MSVENLKEYARRCATEPELRAKAKELGPSDLEGHMREAGGMGLDWTMDDMDTFRKETFDADGELDDLSEEDLEKVAGGIIGVISAVLVAAGAGAAAAATTVVVAGAAGGGAAAAGQGGW